MGVFTPVVVFQFGNMCSKNPWVSILGHICCHYVDILHQLVPLAFFHRLIFDALALPNINPSLHTEAQFQQDRLLLKGHGCFAYHFQGNRRLNAAL